MFKKLKDKLAEEVKSSPQRIQQFAQAAQAAVTSASSSISDITNNDLFSIGGDDTPTQSSPGRPDGMARSGAQPNQFQDVSLGQAASRDPRHDREATPTNDDHFEQEPTGSLAGAGHRLRKLSTGSAASDVSFRLPSYESPNMYHLQSDVEDASEAESVAGGPSLERVSKEQVYAAYRRTRDRYARYRARYADLARHYKTLERENAKARVSHTTLVSVAGGPSLERVSKEQVYAAYRRTRDRYARYRARYADLARHYKTLERENTKARVSHTTLVSVAGGPSLERVSKEQVYAAYRRTRDRYARYRARYADLARHYKTLERENAKARVSHTTLVSVAGGPSLERVSKEQVYAAYRRTRDRYARYRARYADLARHYKTLERENAKARVSHTTLVSVAGGPSLERVSKEQVYAAYRRTRDRYARYRARYADLARHYKTLERENAKARVSHTTLVSVAGGPSLERVSKEQVYAAYRRTRDRYARYRARYADLARHYKTLERENAKARVSHTTLVSVAGGPSLERVSKEQVYAAYRRTRDRYARYRARYADLARHYKTLERENAKARAVLVETQDKALRRISELREQCSLEQSAKAHLENALRVELDERSLKIDALYTKIKLLQSYNGNASPENSNESKSEASDTVPPPVHNLIDLTVEAETPLPIATPSPEITNLNNKLQKMEQLVAKYKESLKTFKEKNSQLTTEIQIVSNELDKKGKENEQLQAAVKQLTEARQQLQELKENINELQYQLDSYDKTKAEEISKVRTELEKARSDIISLNKQINIFTKREEENAISLAENKLSIHKELESKEAEIKLLKSNLTAAHNEIKSYELITDELKQSLKKLEEEKAVLSGKLSELQSAKKTISDLEHKVEDLKQQSLSHEQRNSKIMEEYKCLELQMKQETAEKLAMIDRNNYLENRNRQLTEDNSKKNKQIADLEKEFMDNNSSESKQDIECETLRKDKNAALDEMKIWKSKYNKLESEIKEERVELVKLQSEIEKLLHNYEKLQIENIELTGTVSDLQSQIQFEKEQRVTAEQQFQIVSKDLQSKLKTVKEELSSTSDNMRAMEKDIHEKVMQEAQTQMQSIEATIKESYDIKMAEFISIQEKVSSPNKDSDKLVLELKELRECINTISEEKRMLEETLENHSQLSQEKEILEKRTKELESSFAEFNNLKTDFHQVKAEKDTLIVQVETLDKDNKTLKSKAEQIIKEYEVLSQQKEEFENAIKKAETDNAILSQFKNDFNEALAEKEGLIMKIGTLETENQSLKSKTDQIIKDVTTLQKELAEVKESHDQIEEEKDRLVSKISDMEKDELNKIEKERKLYNETLNKNEEVKKNVDKLNLEMESLLAEKSKIYNQLLESQYDSKEKAVEIIKYKETNEVWQQKLASILEENNILHEKCERLKKEKESFHETVIMLEQKLSEYEKKLKQQEESTIEKEFLDLRINQLENDLQCVNLEKDKLIQQIVDLTESLEKEKAEKEQFNIKIQDLNKNSDEEKSVNDNKISEITASNKNQTETIIALQHDIDCVKNEYSSVLKELNTMKDKEKLYVEEQNSLQSEKDHLNERIKDLAHIENEHKTLQLEYEKLKEDKSRLASDIEGLQVHLTKVSKDNSQLNDRIRDMISHDEDSTNISEKYKEDTSMKVLQEIERLKSDLKSRLDQIEDLERQNAILVEEKLELDDQIKSQNSSNEKGNHIHSATEKELEIARLREKNNDLKEVKMQLESKLADLELQSRSGDSSVQHLEQKNEKLRLNNDKLERRLDEALVSLRHLRALEENTELEYLRNILYEYLTGSGTHSITLAKVLAAVVKFDERQTQLVLQREKERQGLLGQLGLL